MTESVVRPDEGITGKPLPPEAHILVVEDDTATRHLVTRLLTENGYRATGAQDGREAREAFEHATIDLILLDIMLPGGSGLDVCRVIRQKSQVPIIVVSARGTEVDRVLGLELGADDYISKPFSRPELLARIRAVLRRGPIRREGSAPANVRIKRFAGWALDTGRRELLTPDGAKVELSGAEYDVLLAFLEHPQRVLTRDQLLELSRHRISDVFDRSVDTLVSRLRRKLMVDSSGIELIRTVRGAGYVFTPEVSTP